MLRNLIKNFIAIKLLMLGSLICRILLMDRFNKLVAGIAILCSCQLRGFCLSRQSIILLCNKNMRLVRKKEKNRMYLKTKK